MSISNPPYQHNALLLSIQHASVRHLNKTLFQDLSFEVNKGEQWAILGDSGSGKTALLHTLFGKFNITHGQLKYPIVNTLKDKYKIKDPLFNHRQLTAFVNQQAQFKNKENQKNFFYQQRYHAYFSEEASTVETLLTETEQTSLLPKKITMEWVISNLKLSSLLKKTLIQLSNGETRRLQIAVALLKQPIFLFLDNPLIGLDKETRPILKNILEKITAHGIHLIMVTTQREIPDCMTHIAYLDKQSIKFSGSRDQFEPPKNNESKAEWTPDKQLLKQIDTLQQSPQINFTTALELENIQVKSHGNIILEDINWVVQKGEKWSLTGPNGAGKSTLLSLITGDHPQTYANKIHLFDKKRGSGESIWDIKHKMGYVSPEMHQYFRGNNSVLLAILSGLDDTMGFRNKKSNEKEMNLAQNWLQLLDLEPLKDIPFKDLATGNQRLVLLIRALIKNPPLLILDEPCQGLDQKQRNHFKHLINTLWSGKEKTLLYVSHYKEDIPSCVKHVLELESGRAINQQ